MDRKPFDLSNEEPLPRTEDVSQNAAFSPEAPGQPASDTFSAPSDRPASSFVAPAADFAANMPIPPAAPQREEVPRAPYTPPMNATSIPYPPVAQKKKRNTGLVVFLCVVLFLIGIAAGAGVYHTLTSRPAPPANDDVNSSVQNEDNSENTLPEDFTGGTFAPVYGDSESAYSPAEIYKNSINGIVGISTEITTSSGNIFGQPSAYAVSGTGFFFSDDGYILTNCHVVEGASNITVTLYDGTEYTAALVGSDSQNDIAVLKVEADVAFTPLTIGKSAEMVVGEEILVIGNPLGELNYTLTRGIVSNLSREIMVEDNATTIRMFQTDAAINSGNSGGPAINCYGNVIGVVSAKYASSSIEGLGFCIPIDDAMEIAKDLIEHGYVQGRAKLGIEGQAISGYSGSTYVSGVRVTAVQEGSCADRAGIQRGDIITSFETKEVGTIAELKSMLAAHKAGDTVELTVFRNRESIFITVVLDEANG